MLRLAVSRVQRLRVGLPMAAAWTAPLLADPDRGAGRLPVASVCPAATAPVQPLQEAVRVQSARAAVPGLSRAGALLLRLAAHPAQRLRVGSPMAMAWPVPLPAGADRAGPGAHPSGQDAGCAEDPAAVPAQAVRHVRAAGAVSSALQEVRCVARRSGAACAQEEARSVLRETGVRPVEAASGETLRAAAPRGPEPVEEGRPAGVEPEAPAGLQRGAAGPVAPRAADRALQPEAEPWVPVWQLAFWGRAQAPGRAGAGRNAEPSRSDTAL